MPANHTPTPAQSWIVRLARVCWERKKLSVIVVVASVSTILLAALTPLLTRQAVNDALAGNPARLPWLACGLLLIAFFDFIGNYVRRGYAGTLSLWGQHTRRGRVFDSIQKLDGAGQDALRTGQVISRTNSDLQQVHTLLQMCPVPLAVFTYYIAGIAVMLWMSPAMTLIVVCVQVCLAITALRARRRGFAQTGLASDQLANLTEHIREVLAQISVVKSCVAEMRETHWLDRQSRQIVRVRIGAVISQAMPGATMLALPVLGQIVLLCYGGWSVMHGRIDLGTFVAFASFLAMLTGPTRVLASFLVIAQRTQASVERVFALIDTRSQMEDGTESINSQVVGLELENMSFDYHHGDRHILSNISFSLRAGETVAVVGASGSGKSTLIKLLLRELTPTSGRVIVNGADVARLKRRQVPKFRRNLGIVFQDFRLLNDRNVYENVAFAQRVIQMPTKLMRKNVPNALAEVGLAGKYKAKTKQLSGGEQQRVALARALVNEPPILLADEPTGNLDPKNSWEIMKLLERINEERGTTILVVTHNREIVNEMKKRVITMKKGVFVSEEQEGGYKHED